MRTRVSLPATALLLVLFTLSAAAQAPAPAAPAPAPAPAAPPGPNGLRGTAHPDGDALFGRAVYKTPHQLGGKVALSLVTNGEGGFPYSPLSEPIYGLKL